MSVRERSSLIVMNLLAYHCKFGTVEALGIDSMNSLVHSLRIPYRNAGHKKIWHIDEVADTAQGSPLIENPDLDMFRKAHRLLLARYGYVQIEQITVSPICAHVEYFWFWKQGSVDERDVKLHASIVLGINLGLRYYEIRNIQTENVSIFPSICTM